MSSDEDAAAREQTSQQGLLVLRRRVKLVLELRTEWSVTRSHSGPGLLYAAAGRVELDKWPFG